MRTSFGLALALALAGCKKDEARPTEAVGRAAPAPAAAAVELFVDDKPVGKLAPPELAMWPRLDTLVPMSARRLGTWQAVQLVRGGGEAVTVHTPSATYPELVPALFPGDGGLPAFGMFDPVELAKRGAAALRQDRITQVRIQLARGGGRGENDHGDAGGGDPALLVVTIKTAAGEQKLEGKRLLEVARQPVPGHGDGQGWPLTTLLEVAGVTTYERVLVADAAGVNIILDKPDLDPKQSIPFIKLNRQGQLRFRVFKRQGETWQPTAELRGLAHVEILK